MTDTPKQNDELDYILKSHDCTQVAFDKDSWEDYQKMVAKIEELIDKRVREAEDNIRIRISEPITDALIQLNQLKNQ